MPLENGYLLIGRYRILDILGQGGMGAVYRAVDENLDVTVAVKENSFSSEDYVRQFQREAKILALLRHPNLPRVFDYFVVEGQAQYLVMDFIEGEDLRQWMSREEGVTESEALQIGIAMCDALIYLHSRVPAIMHRDIKPGNIKITPSGEIVLVDFGLVKVLSDQEVTTTAAQAMTPGYSPPEQYGETPTDHRSDIFSLGATLYATLTGFVPEDSLARTTGKTSLSPLKSYQPHVSNQTAKAIEKALNLRFEDRWQSAQTFRDALVKARDALPIEKKANSRLGPTNQQAMANGDEPLLTGRDELREKRLNIRWWKQHDPVWLIFGAIVMVLLVVFGVSLTRPDGLQGLFNTSFEPTSTETSGINFILDDTEVTGGVDLEEVPEPTLMPSPTRLNATPNGITPTATPMGGGAGMLAYVSEQTGIPQIWLLDMTSGDSTQLTELLDGACQPDWSPDGAQIVFISPCTAKRVRYPGARIILMDLPTGQLTPVTASLEGDYDPAWSPDGEWIAYTTLINGQRQLVKIHLKSFSIFTLSDGTYHDFSPAWSPNGKQLAFVRHREVDQIWVMDADGENATRFTVSGMINNSNPAWFPDSSMILFSQALGLESPSKQLYGMRLKDIGQGEEYLIIPRTRLDYIPLMDNVDVSPDGSWLAFDYWYFDVLSDIYMMNFPGANLVQLTDYPGFDYDPVWRPLPD